MNQNQISQKESEDSDDRSEDNDIEDESSGTKNNCIICKAGEMIPTVHKGSIWVWN